MAALSNQSGASRSLWFPWGATRRSPALRPPLVRVELIGRENSGKTVLLDMVNRSLMQAAYPSGLQFSPGDPRRVAAAIRQIQDKLALVRSSGMPTTVQPHILEFALCQGDRCIANLQIRDIVGQILSHTTPDSPPEVQALYEEYLGHLAEADVLWVVLPVPAADAVGAAADRYPDDLNLMTAWVREALQRRTTGRPCTIVLAPTKLDVLTSSPEEAHARLTDDVLTAALGPLVPLVKNATKTGQAAIMPVSSLGFGRAALRNGVARTAEATARNEEPVWVLKADESPEPFNVTPLVLWSLLGALLNVEVTAEAGEAEPELARVCRLLSSDLEASYPWCVPLKGPLATRRT